MRKIILMAAAIMFLTGSVAFADYKDTTRQEVAKQLNAFFQAEQGNRLTIYSMKSLMEEVNKVFMNNIVVPDKPKNKKKD